MSTLGPVTPVSGFQVCGSCFGLYGESGDRHQLCSCASPEEHHALSEANYAQDGTYWSQVAEICLCCGAALVDAQYKFARWFCKDCLKRVREVNEACGRCAIPIGWHSIVNGVFIPTNRCKTLTGATAVADQVNAFFRETASVEEWGKRIVERHWRDLGFPLGHDVPVEEYLSAIETKGYDKVSLFDELVAARGVPSHWREFQAIPLELIWREGSGDGLSFLADEEIVWVFPDGEEHYANLTLRVASAVDVWVWEVILDEDAAGDNDPLLAHGVAPDIGEAKVECEANALRLITQEDARSARREEEEREASLNPTWSFPFCTDVVEPAQDWNYVYFDFKKDEDDEY